MIFHEINDQEYVKNPYFDLTLPIILNACEILTWISLSLFVFKMKTIQNRLKTDNSKDFQYSERKNKVTKWVIIGFLVFYIIGGTVIDVLEKDDK